MPEQQTPKISASDKHADLAYEAHSAEFDELIAEREAEYQTQYTQNVYDENRPYQDENGSVHDPANAKFVNSDEYHQKQRDIHAGFDKLEADPENYDEYQDMGVMELAENLAKAELSNDRTKMHIFNEILLGKIIDHAEKLSSKSEQVTSKGSRTIATTQVKVDEISKEVDPEGALVDRVMNYKDSYKAKLEAVSGGPTNEEIQEAKAATRNRIDPEHAREALNNLKENGVPDEILQKIPAEHFYPSSDPESKNQEEPEGVTDWGNADHLLHTSAGNEEIFDEGEFEDEYEDVDVQITTEMPKLSKDPEIKMPVRDWIKKRWNRAKEIAVSGHSGYITGEFKPGKSPKNGWSAEESLEAKSDLRKRNLAIGAGIAAVAGFAVGYIGVKTGVNLSEGQDSINSLSLDGVGDTLKDAVDGVAEAADAPEAPSAEAWTDSVANGEGITHSFVDYAQEHGHSLSPEQAFDIFNQAKEAGLINEDNITNVSSQNVAGGVGFNSPGQTTLSPDLLDFLNKQLELDVE